MSSGKAFVAVAFVTAAGIVVTVYLIGRGQGTVSRVNESVARHEALSGQPKEPARAPAGWVAVIVAREEVDASPGIGGMLESVRVGLGDRVTQGDLIATLDSGGIRKQWEMAKASLLAAEAGVRLRQIELAEARVRNERTLSLEKIVSDKDRASARSQMQLAEARLEVARAALQEQTAAVGSLEETLLRTEVRAPFDGAVAARYRDPGAMVAAGEPIMRLVSSGDLWARFGLSESEAPAVEQGTAITVEVGSLDRPVPGVVRNVAPQVDTLTKLILVEAQLDVAASRKTGIHAGLSGRVYLTSDRSAAGG